MPNTLAHLGVGLLASRCVASDVDMKWVCAGCVIPDLPWILQRIVPTLPLDVDPYTLKLFAISQASLVSCLVLSASLAVLSQQTGRVFLILAGNATIHLLLDSCETKWGSGVHLFAPVSWKTWNLELFWPDSFDTNALTLFGLVYSLFVWWKRPGVAILLTARPAWKLFVALIFLTLYMTLPAMMIRSAENADCHFVRTLMQVDQRPGRAIEFDRARGERRQEQTIIRTFAGEELTAQGGRWNRDVDLSIRGTFVDPQTVLIRESHEHLPGWRDGASMIGLCIVLFVWICPRPKAGSENET